MKKWLEIVLIYGCLGLWWVVKFRWFILACAVVGLWVFVP